MTILFFTLSVLVTILLPVAAAVWLRRRVAVPWWLFCVGIATFVGSQIYHIPLNHWLMDIGVLGPVDVDDTRFLWTAVLLGLSAGMSEIRIILTDASPDDLGGT